VLSVFFIIKKYVLLSLSEWLKIQPNIGVHHFNESTILIMEELEFFPPTQLFRRKV
jgi:hypothetical protein